MKKDHTIIPALTGIRALAVYFIFFKHHNTFTEEGSAANLFVNQFYSFLSFFFVLSGFLICHRYYAVGTLEKKTIWNYFINRITRVFPILLILITATFALQYINKVDSDAHIIKSWFYNITLLKGFSSEYLLTGIGPSWSMSVEELFYLLSPLLFFLIKKPAGIFKFTLSMYALGLVITFLFMQIDFDGFFSGYHFTFYSTFFGRAFEFACGIYLALVMRGKFSDNLLSKIPAPQLTGISIIMLTLIIQFFIAKNYAVVNAVETWPGALLNNLFLPVGITIFFYGLVHRESMIRKMLATKLFVALGNSTYSFYLLHTSFVMGWIMLYISSNLL
ncbi:MAG: acyltransferase, partial [Chitinophagaceae bacterium]